MKTLLNRTEAEADKMLSAVCSKWGTRVCPKVRLADVFQIDGSGLSDREFGFALRSHFDFTVTDAKHHPLFAVEYDGPSHLDARQKERDEMKNNLCQRFGLPLLRVNAKHLRQYRRTDLLSWLVDVWFLQREFNAAQQRGEIPWEEGFDPILLFDLEARDHPWWLSRDVQLQRGVLRKKGTIHCDDPVFAVGVDHNSWRAAVALEVVENGWLYVDVAARRQQFEVPMSDFVEQLSWFSLHERVTTFLSGYRSLSTREEVRGRLHALARRFRLRLVAGPIDLTDGLMGLGSE